MKRKDLLVIPKRDKEEVLHGVGGVEVIPSRRKHGSGWACMDFVAWLEDDSMIGFGGGCDDVWFNGEHFRMDCDIETGCLHIWNTHGTFSVSKDLSSIDFVEEE
jgi:hypothetical protein